MSPDIFRCLGGGAKLSQLRATAQRDVSGCLTKSGAQSPQSCPTLCDLTACSSPQALQSMSFSRQEYWSGLPFPPPRGLLRSGIEPISLVSCFVGGFFTTSTTWEVPRELPKGPESHSFLWEHRDRWIEHPRKPVKCQLKVLLKFWALGSPQKSQAKNRF